MSYNIFDDPEMLEALMQKSEQTEKRAIEENKNVSEVIKQEKQEIFDNIKNIIKEEIENNIKRQFFKKYTDLTDIVKIITAADLLRKENFSLRQNDRQNERESA